MSSVQSSSGSLKTRPRHSCSVQRGTHVGKLNERSAPRQYRQSISPSSRGFGRRRATLHVERRPHSPPSGPNRRFPPERHRTARTFRACPLSPQGSYWLTDVTTPFPGNASASFQQNLNRLPTGGDRIPAPRLLSISRQLESRAERGYSNRRSRAGSPVQRYTGRRNPPKPAEISIRRARSGATVWDRADLRVPIRRGHPNQASTLNCHADIRPGASGQVYPLRYWRRPRPRIPSPRSRARWA